MKEFPTGEKWIQMTDIFHYSHPVNDEYWKRKVENKDISFKIACLKHENIPEYIYYHYKGQQTFAYKYDKYGAIYMYRNILVMYLEYPVENAEYELVPGQWTDEDVLGEYQGDIIKDLSETWQDGVKGWRECDNLTD